MSDAGDDGFTLIAPDFAVEDFTQLIHLLHTGIEAFSWVTVESVGPVNLIRFRIR
jgi:hypothetical protein